MISLVMPTYNGAKYLREQLDSIYKQTIIPDEVIVVDDCSTDNTVQILEEYKSKYGLKYYINEYNLGYNKNFEKAISLSSGDYIALSDQDDIWLPDKLEKCYKKLLEFSQDSPALVSSLSSKCKDILTEPSSRKRHDTGWKHLISIYFTQGCTLMFNRQLVKYIIPFDTSMMYDAYIGYTASLIGEYYSIGEELMYYRIHNDNAFATSTNSLKDRIIANLYRTVPCWFTKERYRHLSTIKEKYKNIIPQYKIDYLNNVLSIYEVNKFDRIMRFIKIKEIPFLIKVKTSLFLFIKIIFMIEDKY